MRRIGSSRLGNEQDRVAGIDDRCERVLGRIQWREKT